MYEKPSIQGNAVAAIIETERGKALKITGIGRFELTMEQTHKRFILRNSQKFFDDMKLSMSNYVRSDVIQSNQIVVWIYSEGEGAVLDYQIKQDSGSGRIMIMQIRTESLKKGWQQVSISVENMMYD